MSKLLTTVIRFSQMLCSHAFGECKVRLTEQLDQSYLSLLERRGYTVVKTPSSKQINSVQAYFDHIEEGEYAILVANNFFPPVGRYKLYRSEPVFIAIKNSRVSNEVDSKTLMFRYLPTCQQLEFQNAQKETP